MIEPQIPFRIIPVDASSSGLFHPGDIISALNECGAFLCTRGEVKLSLDGEVYHILPGNLYIYMPSALVRLISISDDARGVLVAVDVNFALPVAQRMMDVGNLLYIRRHPCVPMSEAEYTYMIRQTERIRERVAQRRTAEGILRQRLMQELVKSMGQTMICEVLNIYFAHCPMQPLSQSTKDVIFHNFLMALFRHFRREREVAFYADLQHLTPRYFSAIIKEKSGSNPLQWIVQMVITEAKLLLETSDLSIKEIAMQLNFPTQSFFGKYFKQYVGVSPKEYREKMQRQG